MSFQTKAYILITISIFEITTAIDAKYLHDFAHYIQPETRIIGGDVAPFNSAPFMVGIRVRYPQSDEPEVCGGTILSDRHVLTAAHCLMGTDNNELTFGVQKLDGTDDAEGYLQIRINESYVYHESYDPYTIQNDIAIITLSTPIDIDDEFVKKVTLPSSKESLDIHNHKTATTYGYGYTHDPLPEPKTVNELRWVNVSIISNDECKKDFGDHIFEGNICTSDHGKKGTCTGDSGGPLILDDVQIGITSYGDELCETDMPSVYVRVDRYLDWIEEKTGKK